MAWYIYLIGISEGVSVGLGVVSGLAIMALGGAKLFAWMDSDDDMQDRLKRKRIWPWGVMFFMSFLIPSPTTLSAMYLLPKIVENKMVVDIPDKAMTVLNAQLDKWIKDLSRTER